MKKIIGLASGLLITLTAMITLRGTAEAPRPLALEHTLSIVQRPDGLFDITCLDGLSEVRSQAELLGNQICTHLKTYSGLWTLIEGGVDNGARFCDMNIRVIRSSTAILSLKAGFAAPCTGGQSESQQCSGLSCSLQLSGKYYSLDFNVGGYAKLTRLEDGLTATYRGNAGGGSGSSGTARLVEIDGVQNILQTTNDGGTTWLSVCDDNFGEEEAAVACRELGLSSEAGTFTLDTAVFAGGDNNYGLDELSCTGSELTLNECQHSPWKDENCDEAEHVKLICAP